MASVRSQFAVVVVALSVGLNFAGIAVAGGVEKGEPRFHGTTLTVSVQPGGPALSPADLGLLRVGAGTGDGSVVAQALNHRPPAAAPPVVTTGGDATRWWVGAAVLGAIALVALSIFVSTRRRIHSVETTPHDASAGAGV
jgi:hypothetical protein